MRIAGNGSMRTETIAAGEVVAVYEVARPGRPAAGRHKKGDVVLREQRVDTFFACKPQGSGTRFAVSFLIRGFECQREDVLPEPAKFLLCIG